MGFILNRKLEIRNNLLGVSAIIGIIGSVITIIGSFLPFHIYPNRDGKPGFALATGFLGYDDKRYAYPDLRGWIVVIVLLALLIISILTLIGVIRRSNLFSDERPLFYTCSVFILFPIVTPMTFSSPLIFIFYALGFGTRATAVTEHLPSGDPSIITLDAGFYLMLIGALITLAAFFMIALDFFWKYTKRRKDFLEIRKNNSHPETKIVNTTKFVLGIIIPIVSLGIILGYSIPYYDWVFRTTVDPDYRNPSFLISDAMYWDGDIKYASYFNFEAFFPMLFYLFAIISSIFMVLANRNRLNKPDTILPTLVFLFIPSILPVFSPIYGDGIIWQSPIAEMLYLMYIAFNYAKQDKINYDNSLTDIKRVMTPIAIIFVICALLLFLVLIFSITMFFWNKKAKELLMQLIANDEPKIDLEGISKMEENIAKAKK